MKAEMDNLSVEPRSLWGDAWLTLKKSRVAMVCLWLVVLYSGIAAVGYAIDRHYAVNDMTPPYKVPNLDRQYVPPSFCRPLPPVGETAETQGWRRYWNHLADHPMGTDGLGRDVFQRIVQGTRIAFLVGIVTAMIAIPIGVVLGCLAGYFGGFVDDFIVWLYSTFAAIPGLLFILSIALVVDKGLKGVFLGIGLTTWVGLCRLIRGEVMKHKERTYVKAAETLGLGHGRIMFRHILPNIFHIVIVTFTIRFPAAVGTEVIMSYLGIGVQDEPSWGIMISDSRLRLWHGAWWEITFATIAIFGLVLAFNLLGDALRDALDPRLKEQG